MKKYLFIVLLVWVCFGQSKEEITDHYLGNQSNYLTIDKDIRNVIDNELSKIYMDLDSVLTNVLRLKTEIIKVEKTGEKFDKNAWIKACLMRGYRSGDKEANALRQWYWRDTYTQKKYMINRKIKLIDSDKYGYRKKYDFNWKSLLIDSKKPNWLEIVKNYGYAKLGKIGAKKEEKNKFDLNQYFCEIELIDNEKCILYSKYFGDKMGFDYHKISLNDTSIHYGNYIIDPIDWNILKGGKKPKIRVKTNNEKFSLDLYEVEPLTAESVKKRFNQHKNIIYDMMDDLVVSNIEHDNQALIDDWHVKYRDLIKASKAIHLFIEEVINKEKERYDYAFDNENHIKHEQEKSEGVNLTIKLKRVYDPASGVVLFNEGEYYSFSKAYGVGLQWASFKKIKNNTTYEVFVLPEYPLTKGYIKVGNENISIEEKDIENLEAFSISDYFDKPSKENKEYIFNYFNTKHADFFDPVNYDKYFEKFKNFILHNASNDTDMKYYKKLVKDIDIDYYGALLAVYQFKLDDLLSYTDYLNKDYLNKAHIKGTYNLSEIINHFIKKYTKEDYNYFKFDGKLVGVRNSADPALLNRLSYDNDDEYFKQKRIDAINEMGRGW